MQDYAHWDAAFDWVKANDVTAIYDNIGGFVGPDEIFDFIYILDSDGSALYAYDDPAVGSDLSIVGPNVTSLMLQVMRNATRQTGRTAIGTSFMQIDDTLYVVGVTRILTSTDIHVHEVAFPYFIGAVRLDPEYLGSTPIKYLSNT